VETIEVVVDGPFRQQWVAWQGQVSQIIGDVIHRCIAGEIGNDLIWFEFDYWGAGLRDAEGKQILRPIGLERRAVETMATGGLEVRELVDTQWRPLLG
jgi:hypothetical protein